MTEAQVLADIDARVDTNGIGAITGNIANDVLKNTIFKNIENRELSALTLSNTAIVVNDTIKTALGKLQGQINGLPNAANNGLSLSGGNTVQLGGSALNQNTNITGNYDLYLGTSSSQLANQGSSITGARSYFAGSYSGANTEWYQDPTEAWIATSNFLGYWTGLSMAGSGYNVLAAGNGSNNIMVIGDAISNKGLVYNDDYSANFTNESLPSVRYVNSAIAASTLSSGNAVTVAAGAVNLGGGLNQNTAIDGYYDFLMGQSSILNSFKVRTENGIELRNYSGGTYNYYIDFGTGNGTGVTITADDDQGSPLSSFNVNPYSIKFNTPILEISQNTILSSNGNTLAMDFNSIIDMDPNGNGNVTGFNSGTAYLYLNANSGTSEIGYGTVGSQRFGLACQSNGMFVFDYFGNFAGLQYGANYSANYSTRSLVDKGYVTSTFLSLAGGTLTGNLNGITPTEITNLSGSTSNIQNQLNNLAIGIGGWKAAARVLCNTNINLSAPGAALDGVTMAAGDRFVPNAQTTASQNGVYVWNGAATPATRATDCSTGGTSNTGVLGMVITIEEGTYADQFWVLTTNAPITIGTTSLSYAKGSATTYTGSNGISLSGNNFIFDYAYFTGNVTVSSGGVMTIGAAQVTNAMLAGSIDLTSKVTGVLPVANTEAKIKGSIAATAGLIPFATGVADTVTTNTSFYYESANGRLLVPSANSATNGFKIDLDASNSLSLSRYTNASSGSFVGTSVSIFHAAWLRQRLSNTDNNGTFVIGGSPIINLVGTASTNYGTRLSAVGLRVDTLANVHTDASALLHINGTTEQLRVGYDASNYFSTTVASTGSTTFNLAGTSPTFTFTPLVNMTSGFLSSTKGTISNGLDGLVALQINTGANNRFSISTVSPGGHVQLRTQNGADLRMGVNTNDDITIVSGGAVTLRTSLSIATGSVIASSTGLTIGLGKVLNIKSGTDQRAGNATLVSGTVTVSNTTITANTTVILTRKTSGGTIGTITYTVTAGTSFTIVSDNVLDTSTVSYVLIEVN